MSKYRHHTLDIYGAELYLATDLKQWRQLRAKVDGLEKTPDSGGRASLEVVTDTGSNVPHIPVFIDRAALGDDGTLLVNTCAHEATHVAAMLLDHIGQEPGNSEALAYLAGWVAGWLWEGCVT